MIVLVYGQKGGAGKTSLAKALSTRGFGYVSLDTQEPGAKSVVDPAGDYVIDCPVGESDFESVAMTC
jgi:adenylate kinase family enzyme